LRSRKRSEKLLGSIMGKTILSRLQKWVIGMRDGVSSVRLRTRKEAGREVTSAKQE
jgi:hypothetical protein